MGNLDNWLEYSEAEKEKKRLEAIRIENARIERIRVIKEEKRRKRIKKREERKLPENKKQIFKINEFLSVIYNPRGFKKSYAMVKNEIVIQCRYLLIDIDPTDLGEYDEFKTIDQIKTYLEKKKRKKEKSISQYWERPGPLTEFWGHSSNLQVWAEHEYNVDLIHSNLGLPLLKKLFEVGDPIAKRVYKEEIAHKLEDDHLNGLIIMLTGKYLDVFNKEELDTILEDKNLLTQAILRNHKSLRTKTITETTYETHDKKEKNGLVIDNIIGLATLDEREIDENNFSRKILLKDRGKLKRVKFLSRETAHYDFDNVDKDGIRTFVSYTYFWLCYRLLNKNKDSTLYIPGPNNSMYLFVSKEENLFVSLAPQSFDNLEYRLKYFTRKIKNIHTRRKAKLTRVMQKVYETIKQKECMKCNSYKKYYNTKIDICWYLNYFKQAHPYNVKMEIFIRNIKENCPAKRFFIRADKWFYQNRINLNKFARRMGVKLNYLRN